MAKKRDKTTRLLGSMKPKKQPIADNFILPNNSGDHVRSIKRAVPVDDADLVNKKYVDDEITTAGLWEVVGLVTRLKTADEIDMQTKRIVNVVDPILDQDAATKKYVDDEVAGAPPGGNNTEIQFNDSGAFAGDDELIWDNTNKILGVGKAPTNVATVEVEQIADNKGFRVYGFDDRKTYFIEMYQTLGTVGAFNATSGYSFQIGGTVKVELGATEFSFRNVHAKLYDDKYFKIGSGRDWTIGAIAGESELHICKSNGLATPIGEFKATGLKINGTVEIPKSKMTAIGGFAIKLTNQTGANSVQGETVKTDAANDDSVVLCATADDDIIGVFLEAGIADGAEAWIVVNGIADVLADTAGFTRGDRLVTSLAAATVARATTNNAPAVAVHFQEIGHALETAAANTLGRCVLHFN